MSGAAQSNDFWLVAILEEKDLRGITRAPSLEVVVNGAKEILRVVTRGQILVPLFLLEGGQTDSKGSWRVPKIPATNLACLQQC